MIWVGTWLGMIVRSPDAVMGVGVHRRVPADVPEQRVRPDRPLPNVLQWIASVNPVSVLSSALRELFGNPLAPVTKHIWPIEHPVPAAWLYCDRAVGVGLRRRAAPLPHAHDRLSLGAMSRGTCWVASAGLGTVSHPRRRLARRHVGPVGMADHTSGAIGRHRSPRTRSPHGVGRVASTAAAAGAARGADAPGADPECRSELADGAVRPREARRRARRHRGAGPGRTCRPAPSGWPTRSTSRCRRRKWIRVGRALEHLPVIDASFEAGLSYSKVRVLTRLAHA